MRDPSAPIQDPQIDARRSARRTALIVAAIAMAIYAGFIVLNSVAQ